MTRHRRDICILLAAGATILLSLAAVSRPQELRGTVAKPPAVQIAQADDPAVLDFPQGTATPSEFCGACHQAIYREFAEGFGADLQYGEILYEARDWSAILGMPAKTSMPTLHALAGTDPFPLHARTIEEGGRSCNVCHFPEPFEIPDINRAE